MNHNMKTLLIIIAALLLLGCGARKVQVQKENVQVKQDVEQTATVAENKEAAFTETKTEELQELVIEPVDSDKPLTIVEPSGRKTTVLNGRISSRKSKAQSEVAATVKAERNEAVTSKVKAKTNATSKTKATERKDSLLSLWWLLLLIPLGYGIYRLRSRAV